MTEHTLIDMPASLAPPSAIQPEIATATPFIEHLGMQVTAARWAHRRQWSGELDIVAVDGNSTVIVLIHTRPLVTTMIAFHNNLIRSHFESLAQAWITEQSMLPDSYRFDLVTVSPTSPHIVTGYVRDLFA